jgi:hypothetical protein
VPAQVDPSFRKRAEPDRSCCGGGVNMVERSERLSADEFDILRFMSRAEAAQ